MKEIEKLEMNPEKALEMRQMIDIYSTAVTSGVTGAAAGAVVALAASGSLSVIGSEMALAGSLLTVGEVGAAASMAGSAISFGMSMTPLAAVAAPVILFTGISASLRAEENLEKANATYAEAVAASEKMKISETLCNAIQKRSNMYCDLLVELNGMFSECTGLMISIVNKKEGRLRKKKLNSQNFSEEELQLIAVTRALAGAVKAVIDTPIISADGNISAESDALYSQTSSQLMDFTCAIEDIRKNNYRVRPVKIKIKKDKLEKKIAKSEKNGKGTGSLILYLARNILAFLLGGFVATKLAIPLATKISLQSGKFLFLDSYLANIVAVWLIICTTIVNCLAKFKKTMVTKGCTIGFGIGIAILYCEYCRVVEAMNHRFLFSLAVMIAVGILFSVIMSKDANAIDHWWGRCTLMLLYVPIYFLIYIFFCDWVGFSDVFCLVCTTCLQLATAIMLSIVK